jgi:hypothetical protein
VYSLVVVHPAARLLSRREQRKDEDSEEEKLIDSHPALLIVAHRSCGEHHETGTLGWKM